jgi:hypothetical protein
MTRLAALKTHRRMFEREWPALVAVAFEASRVVGGEALEHSGPHTTMRIVAIHAAHVTFGKFVMEGHLELSLLV